jgi:hypothetical protein
MYFVPAACAGRNLKFQKNMHWRMKSIEFCRSSSLLKWGIIEGDDRRHLKEIPPKRFERKTHRNQEGIAKQHNRNFFNFKL